MKNLLITHRLAVFFALFSGVVIALPALLPYFTVENYGGILNLPLSSENIYLSRIHEILDGNWSVASPFFHEYKDFPVAIYPVNEWIYAVLAYVFGLQAGIIAAKALLPMLLFLLTYFFVLRIIGNRTDVLSIQTALSAALLVVLGTQFVAYSAVFQAFVHFEAGPVLWSRLVNPIVGGIQIMALLLLISMIWQRKRYATLASGVVAASTVGYFFSLATSLALLGTFFLIALARKEYAIAKALGAAALIAGAIDSWWWYKTLLLAGGETGKLVSQQNGMFFTHAPVLNKAVLAATILTLVFFCFSYFYKKHRDMFPWLFVAALMATSWIVFNQQIITGRQIWYYHFVQYTVPFSMIAIITAGYLALRDHAKIWLGCTILISAASVCYGLISVASYQLEFHYLVEAQRYAGVVGWLNANAGKDCVVLTNVGQKWEPDRIITGYTSCDTYTGGVTYAGVPPERVKHNFFLGYQLLGVGGKEFARVLTENPDSVRSYFYGDWHQMFGHGLEPWVEQKISELALEYDFFEKTPLRDNIKKYRADYFFSETAVARTLLNKMPEMEIVTTAGGYYLYGLTLQ